MSWESDLRSLLDRAAPRFGLERLSTSYEKGFSPVYRALFRPRDALRDVFNLDAAVRRGVDCVDLRAPDASDPRRRHRLLLYSAHYRDLCNIMPPLRNMGLSVSDQVQFKVDADGRELYIRVFSVTPVDDGPSCLQRNKKLVLEALRKLFADKIEDDPLNALITLAGVDWKMVEALRAYCNYYLQIDNRFERVRVHEALISNRRIAILLRRYFEARFNPDPDFGDAERRETEALTRVRIELIEALERVADIAADRILRDIFNLIDATLRTNFFLRLDAPEPAFSFKINSLGVINMATPRPLVEIYVHSRLIEGAHLRGARVARGGIRWSDRSDDFRQEILGLMRTQMMKNALIVPQGAKGGFVVKRPPVGQENDPALVLAAYSSFIAALLDLTDNIRGNEVLRPPKVVAYDDDDPYLVVAADKGTAGFSDRANEISREYDYWLGDSFATGGSHGFHHKRLGITARGAWVCVRRHFRELGVDPDVQAVTVVGVGGMEGDVFGNGMLRTSNLRLLGAFNAEFIFLDPSPDGRASFAERKRLFETPGSTWADYNAALISPGGGVFRRSAKDIEIGAEVRRWLGVRARSVDGEELVRLLLSAPVDLLWMGGIGTYVKATSETDETIGDRANDSARIDAARIRAKVVGEGANLGFSQKARIEYALGGGHINTDAVDNSAGVDLSDHEVNLKILFAHAELGGGMDEEERNRILGEVGDEVCSQVLDNCYSQSLSLSLERKRCAEDMAPFLDLADELERLDLLDRSVESFPSRKEALARGAAGLTRPELAVLMAYAKLALKRTLLETAGIPEDEWIYAFLGDYFPARVRLRQGDRLKDHPLGRDIAVTVICNRLIDRAGAAFLVGVDEFDSVRIKDAIGLYLAFDRILQGDRWREAIRGLDGKLPPDRQYELLLQLEGALAFLTRWAWEHGRRLTPAQQSIAGWRTDLTAYMAYLGESAEFSLLSSAAPEASRLLFLNRLRDFPILVDLSRRSGENIAAVARAFDELVRFLGLRHVGTLMLELRPRNLWERRLQGALDDQFRSGAGRLVALALGARMRDPAAFFHGLDLDSRLARFQRLLSELQDSPPVGFEPFATLAAELELFADACGAAVEARRAHRAEP
ncbi:NAD-glutamate dehydrogenase [Methylocystis heyeri]|uniref:NAD-glutamate dehydrogenase n=1 Tax=Methylocystis heyeri TaxID=391905 RepID=A0A6B8KKY9_9HYPH|nr:NAD-glutamate dehydrogenase domain-containing protein [Methylocystis heyeri]QGM47253.1 NAD-glutamate dehydrogenase [Methylocystis heyeri]